MQKKTAIMYAVLKKAQAGHKESLCTVTMQARKEVLAYLLRLTLDIHVAEDLCQETIIQMLKSLPDLELKSEKSFWAWLYKTALSRVSRHFRHLGKTRQYHHVMTNGGLTNRNLPLGHNGPELLIQKELTRAITEAMNALKLRYRNILTLRCFQDLSYAEIALTTGGTELQARLLFYRAKRLLRHQLATRGFKTKEHLLPALSLFAALTADQSKAASASVGIKASSLTLSAGTTTLGIATTKLGIAAMVAVVVGILGGTAGRVVMSSDDKSPHIADARVKNQDTSLLDLMQGPDFMKPSAIGKASKGVSSINRTAKTPVPSKIDFRVLQANEPQPDRANLLPDQELIVAQFANPIVDGPGADVIIAGWSDPGPAVEVIDSEGRRLSLSKPTQLRDTWDRLLLGYDLAELPQSISTNSLCLIGTHNQGPRQGYELNEISVRQ